ncbi:KLF8 factor, partial [Cepphus grylle]|nr:KLF8 factor [Cepphus grylle]
MSSSALLAEGPLDPPVLLSDIKTEPPEELLASDCSQPQAEPVDLSLNKSKGSGGQQILHVIHTIPSVNLPSKMGNLQTIPVVVQSLPVVYTTMPTDGVTAITVPLIGGDGKNAGSVKIDPGSMYPMAMSSDSEDSASESGPAPFQDLQRE